MLTVISHINSTWPGTPIWMRKLHRVGPVGGASCSSFPSSSIIRQNTNSDSVTRDAIDDWRHTGASDPGGSEGFSNFFTDVRIHQIREMQDQVAITAGIPSFDFGDIWEGWQSQQQMVHPLLVSCFFPFLACVGGA